VADGMGGMAAGEIASQAAVEAVSEAAISELAGSPGACPSAEAQSAMLERWALDAHARVRGALDALKARGGCTLLCACLVDRRLAIAHVGDCRLYLARDEQLELLTRDHSAAMERCLREEIAPDDLRLDPDRSVLTRSLGGAWPPEVDTLAEQGES